MALHAITGAFGFSGSYLAQRLLDAGEYGYMHRIHDNQI